jgi:putative tricarboxylic transport membrane protein
MYFLEFLSQLARLTAPGPLLVLVATVLLGILFGAMPGLTATLGVALLTAVTFNFTMVVEPLAALDYAMISLIGLYVGAIYGGSHPAILLGIPGTGAAAATALEGRALCEQGRAGEALGTATIASFVGTATGVLVMLTVIPLLLQLALRFTSVEYFLLAFFGVLICGSLSSPDTPLKGWIAGLLGLLLASVGDAPLQAYSRFTFGIPELKDGIRPIPVILGGFAIPQIIRSLSGPNGLPALVGQVRRVVPRWRVLRENLPTAVRSGVAGVSVGSIPGVGEDVAAWLSYDAAKKFSRRPDEFGRGSVEGVVAAETANNACIGGALVPLLSLGIPGSPPAAMLLGALLLHHVVPGPLLAEQRPTFIPMMCAILLLAALVTLGCGFAVSRLSVHVLQTPPALLMPVVAVFSVIGSFALDNLMLNVWCMLAFGVVAFFLQQLAYPIAPFVIGLILGPMADENLRLAMTVHQGSLLPFVTRPIALILLGLITLSLLSQTSMVKLLRAQLRRRHVREEDS